MTPDDDAEGTSSPDDGRELTIPPRLTWAAGIAVRVWILAGTIVLIGLVLWHLRVVVLPCFVALFLATVLHPPTDALKRRGVPPLASASVVVAGAFAVLGFVAWLIIPPVVDQFDDLASAAEAAIEDVQEWFEQGPLELDADDVDDAVGSATSALTADDGPVVTGVVSGAVTVVEFVVGLFVTIVLTFLILKDGDRMVQWLLNELPARAAKDARHLGRRAWSTLRGYFRGVTIDGVVEAVLIGIGLVLLGVPLALPLAVITFFGGYFPLIGALVAGALAASVALVSEGPVVALLVIAWAIVVQNIASNVLDPLIMSRTVRIHPAVVLLAVTTGGLLGGIIGAFVAVPVTAVALSAGDYYLHERPDHQQLE